MTSAGRFKALITGLFLSAVFALASATIAQAAPPANDDFANAQVLAATLPVSATGTNAEATVQTGEPEPDAKQGDTHSVWYSWTAPSSGPVTVDAGGSNYPAFVTVYTGTAVDNLTQIAIEPLSFANQASFRAVSGTTYRIAIDGYYGLTGPIDFDITATGMIAGNVTNDADDPVEDVCVDAYDSDSNYVSSGRTDADGDYEVGGLGTDDYRLELYACFDGGANVLGEYYENETSLEDATPVPVTAGAVTSGIDAGMRTGGSISGTVVDGEGDPLEGICTAAYFDNNSYREGPATDADGNYTIPRLTTDIYRVEFSDCEGDVLVTEFFENQPNYERADNVSVTVGSDVPDIDAVMEAPGQISGRVTETGGIPLADICVRSYFNGEEGDGDYDESTTTDANGDYTLDELLPGDYKLRFSDCDSEEDFTTEFYDGASTLEEGDIVEVEAGAETDEINAALERKGAISGIVTNGASEGLENVCVTADGGDDSDFGRTVFTDSQGEYFIDRVPAGTYTLDFEDCGEGIYLREWYDDQPTAATADPVTVEPEETTTDIDAELAVGGTISGNVTDLEMNPLDDICVDVRGSTFQYNDNTSTDSSGNYTVAGLPTGNYKVGFRRCGNNNVVPEYYDNKPTLDTATEVPVTAGADTEDIDASLAPGAGFSGTVTNASSNPVFNICVSAYAQGSGINDEPIGGSYTDSNGHYEVIGLPPGDYIIEFRNCAGSQNLIAEYWNNKPTAAAADPLPLTGGTVTPDINAQLATGGTISGVVTDTEGDPIIPCATAYDADGNYAGQDFGNGNGEYTISGLATGTYRIYFQGCDDAQFANEYYDDKRTLATATPVDVVAGSDTPGINAQLAPGGSFSGTVTDSEGEPLENICVQAFDSNGVPSGTDSTESDGSYEIWGLTVGDHRAQFTQCGGAVGLASEYYDDEQTLADATPIPVTADTETPDIDAELEPLGTPTGPTGPTSPTGPTGPTGPTAECTAARAKLASAQSGLKKAVSLKTKAAKAKKAASKKLKKAKKTRKAAKIRTAKRKLKAKTKGLKVASQKVKKANTAVGSAKSAVTAACG